jgi:hypothetical protein
VLKEGWTWIDFLATCVCFAGVVCVAQPAAIFGHSDGPVAATGSTVVPAVVALASAIVSSSGFVVIRVLGGLVDANVVVFWYGLVGVLMSMLATVAMETFVWSLTASQYGETCRFALCSASRAVCYLLPRSHSVDGSVCVLWPVVHEQGTADGKDGTGCYDAVRALLAFISPCLSGCQFAVV